TERQRHLPHVAHHTDDGVRWCVVRATDANVLADRVGVPEREPRERLADDCDERRAGPVVVVEQTAAPKRDVHRLEVSRAHRVTKYAVPPRGLDGSRLEARAILVEVSAQRQLTRERYGCDTRHLPNTSEYPGEELVPGAVRAQTVPGRLHLHREH